MKSEELLIYETVNGNEKKALEIAKVLFNTLQKNTPLPKGLVGKILLDMMVSINRLATEQSLEPELFYSKNFSISDIQKITDVYQGLLYLENFIIKFCHHRAGLRKEKEEKLIGEITHYVNSTFSFDKEYLL